MEAEKHPFYAFCENRMISQETQDEFVMFFRKYLDRYFIINNELLYSQIAEMIPMDQVQEYWNIFINEKEANT